MALNTSGFLHLQHAQNTATGAATVAATVTAVGSLQLVVVNLICYLGTAPTGMSVTDSAGNTYALAIGPIGTISANGKTINYQFYGVALTSGATTITANWTGSNSMLIEVDVFSGNAATNAAVFSGVTSSVLQATASTSAVFSSFNPGGYNQLIVAAYGVTSSTTATAGTNYTIGLGTSATGFTEYRLANGISETVPMTFTASRAYTGVAAVYNAAPVSGLTTYTNLNFEAGGAGPYTMSFPNALPPGALLLITDRINTFTVITTPTGWNSADAGGAFNSSGDYGAMFWKQATGSETSVLLPISAAHIATLYVITGFQLPIVQDSTSTYAIATATSITSPATTTTNANDAIFTVVHATVTAPSGTWSLSTTITTPASSNATVGIYTPNATGSYGDTLSGFTSQAVLAFSAAFKITYPLQTPVLPFQIPNKFVGPMALRNAFIMRSPPITATYVGQQYVQNLTGGLSFTGNFNKQNNKSLVGAALSFTGNFATTAVHYLSFVAGLSYTGAFNKLNSKILTPAVLSFTGAFAYGAQHFANLTAGLSFTGSFGKQALKNFTGGLSFTGNFNKQVAKNFVAGLSFTGGFIKTINKKIYGSIMFNPTTGWQFDGTQNYGSFTNSAANIAGSATWSFIATVQPEDNPYQSSAILNLNMSYAGATGVAFEISGDGAGKNLAVFGMAANTGKYGAIAIKAGQKHTVAATWDGTTLRLYVDGAADSTFTGVASAAGTGASYLVGAESGTINTGSIGGRHMHGIINDVRAYTSRVLTPTEISNYASGTIPTTTNMVLGYNFSEGSGTTTADLSGNGQTLSMQGTPKPTWSLFTTNFSEGAIHYLSFTGALSFVGAFAKQAQKNFTGALSYTGAFTKRIGKNFSGGLSFTGSIAKKLSKSFTGSLSFTGSITKNAIHYMVFTASVGFSGVMATFKSVTAFIYGMIKPISQIDQKQDISLSNDDRYSITQINTTDNVSLSNDDRYPIGQQKEVVDLDQQE